MKWKMLAMVTGGGTYYKQYRGLSTWDKPKETPETGDELIEIDTGKVFMFADGNWYPL